MSPAPNALLDLPPFPAHGYAELADRIAALLGTKNDVLLVQGEAIVALEAAAASLGQPGLHAINIVTSPYGLMFAGWLRRAGAIVVDVVAEPGLPIALEAVKAAFDANPQADLLSVVHAESASGILNPLEDIVALARERGVLTLVDAVASAGGHALDIDALGLDVVVTGPQKSLGGSPGLSTIALSPAAWVLADHPATPKGSILSLLDHRRLWLDTGRGVLPGMPSTLEFWALAAALDRVEAEGMTALIARHALAAEATRSALLRGSCPTGLPISSPQRVCPMPSPPHRCSLWRPKRSAFRPASAALPNASSASITPVSMPGSNRCSPTSWRWVTRLPRWANPSTSAAPPRPLQRPTREAIDRRQIIDGLDFARAICRSISASRPGNSPGERMVIFRNPLHPYTEALLAAIPGRGVKKPKHRIRLSGHVPDASQQLKGCTFADRCQYARPACRDVDPPLEGTPDHRFACIRADELNLRTVTGEPELVNA